MLSEPSKTAAHSAKCFPSPRKRLRAPRNAFRILGNFCALREMPSELSETAARSAKCLPEPSETAARSAKCFPNPRKQLRAPRNAFPSSRKRLRAQRSPSRILGNLHALREGLPDTSETFTFRKTKGNPALGPSKPSTRAPHMLT